MKPEDVILYHGSLEELNSRDPSGDIRYCFSPIEEFVSERQVGEPTDPKETIKIREEILGRGFHGLVNRKTLWSDWTYSGSKSFRIEGTPIMLEGEE